MSEETRRVLDLLAHSKITVEEADQLLAAIGGAGAAAAAEGGAASAPETSPPKYLRIAVTKIRGGSEDETLGRRWWTGEERSGRPRAREITVRVPVTLVKNGLRLGGLIPGIVGSRLKARLRERGVDLDLSKIDLTTIDELLREFGEMNIDIDAGSRSAQVRITCE